MNNEIKVSIIITTFNKLKYFRDTINSAINQNFDSFEIIVIDDHSTDGTIDALKSFENSLKVECVRFFYMEKNRGVVYCRNFGINVARGKYILPLDGDDLITEDYIKISSDYMDNNADCGICYCQARLFGKKNELWNFQHMILKKFGFKIVYFLVQCIGKVMLS